MLNEKKTIYFVIIIAFSLSFSMLLKLTKGDIYPLCDCCIGNEVHCQLGYVTCDELIGECGDCDDSGAVSCMILEPEYDPNTPCCKMEICGGCEVYCQTTCETSCQSGCETTCQTCAEGGSIFL